MKCYGNLKEKRKEKQRKYELSVLRDIHIRDIRCSAKRELLYTMSLNLYDYATLERIIIDYTIEIYLYGASFGRWGYYGEDFAQIQQRMKGKEHFMAEELYQALCKRMRFLDENSGRKILYMHTQSFVYAWLQKGFSNGVRKYKLKIVT